MMSHVETTNPLRKDIAAVRAAIDAAGHPALLAVDAIASLGCDVIEMDLWGIDVLVGASQKGLMTPPGLGFVWVSEKALDGCAESDCRTPYWDWTPRVRPNRFYQRFGGTAPTHHLFGLRTALDMILHEEGLEAVWRRHAKLAQVIWQAYDGWAEGDGRHSAIALHVSNPRQRSHAVTTVRFATPLASDLRRWLSASAGVTLGVGIGMVPEGDPQADGYLRVGHMGHVNAHMTLGLLGAIEAAMVALNIAHNPHGLARAAAAFAT